MYKFYRFKRRRLYEEKIYIKISFEIHHIYLNFTKISHDSFYQNVFHSINSVTITNSTFKMANGYITKAHFSATYESQHTHFHIQKERRPFTSTNKKKNKTTIHIITIKTQKFACVVLEYWDFAILLLSISLDMLH